MGQTGKQYSGDKRIKKTKDQLRKSLMQLLNEKSVSAISIREITDLAELNRSTFYLHYDNVNDMIVQLLKELSTDFDTVFQKYRTEEISQRKLEMITDIFQMFSKHSDLALLIFSNRLPCDFIDEMERKVKGEIKEWALKKNPEQTSAGYDYHFNFVSNGFKLTIVNWIQGGMKETPEELSKIMMKFLSPPEKQDK